MIPLHATATADPRRLRWVVAPEQLPARGVVRRAPGRLGALLRTGVIDAIEVRAADVMITLGGAEDWRARGDDVRRALGDALAEPSGWDVAPNDDASSVAAVAAELLAGPVGALAASHGGSIELVSVEGDAVRVRLAGACHGCSSAAVTLHDALQRELCHRTGREITVSAESYSAAIPLGRKLLSLFVR